jgi:hypothetical protein
MSAGGALRALACLAIVVAAVVLAALLWPCGLHAPAAPPGARGGARARPRPVTGGGGASAVKVDPGELKHLGGDSKAVERQLTDARTALSDLEDRLTTEILGFNSTPIDTDFSKLVSCYTDEDLDEKTLQAEKDLRGRLRDWATAGEN